MKIEKTVSTVYRLELSEEEGKLLKGLLQNIDPSASAEVKKLTEDIFNSLDW